MKIRRVRRGCYDKYHRCSGWAGGGMRYTDHRVCPDGSLSGCYDKRLWKWRFNTCNKGCGTLVLPYATRWIDPSWIWYEAKSKLRDWKHERSWRRNG